MNLERGHFTQSVVFRLILSYAVILCIPVILSVIIYGQTRGIVKNEIKLASGAMLQQVRYIVDGELLQTESLAAQLAVHSEVKALLSSSTKENAYRIYRLKQELNKMTSANNFIKEINLYSKPLQSVLSSETYVKEQSFYEMKLQTDTFTYEDWQALLNRHHPGEYMLLPLKNQDQKVTYTPFYVRSLPIQTTADLAGTLIIPLNVEKLTTILSNIDWIERGQVFIMDTKGQIMIQNAGEPVIEPSAYQEWNDRGTGTFTGTFQGVKSMITIESSDTTGWKYISVFPTEVFWEQAGGIQTMNMLGLLLCFAIGSAVIYYFARKNYNPVKELVSVFSRNPAQGTAKYLDEYTFIRRSVLETIRERDDIHSKHDQQLRVLQNYYLGRLLKGQADRNVPLTELAKTHKFAWPSDQFAVLLFYIGSGGEESHDLALSQFIVSNIVADVAGNRLPIHFTDVDGMLAAVVNVDPQGGEHWKDELEADLAKAYDFIAQRYKLRITTAGSELQTGLEGVHLAFLQALEAQEYCIVRGEGRLIWYGNIKPGESSSYFFTVNDQMMLINFLRADEFGKAREMVLGIIEQAFQKERSHEIAKCILLDVATTLIKAIPDQQQTGIAWDEWKPLKRLLSCSTKLEFEQEILGLFDRVCEALRSKSSLQTNAGIGEKVIAFVQENYADKELSVSLIGDHLRLTPQYVSRLFREQTGQAGLHDYISQTRIEAAKLLLQQGTSIDETAARVGFASSHAFIRVFKKYEGITPGKYKMIQ
ncbi:HTH-type transcriptional activator RhaR [Paenibacillus auburnensis]|uniref:HTH-type transcriptional activator RhaR n=1 Tax=Paenibacillus auburnensis TaxID=2905649 RepID=A0ABM9CUA7_9BACL|nr:helix-turn-helix domain-containing protein [Paenibacillus auburnensis]CAH1222821.1 HTH-type transcriptional activator RhaR [Paenibacillus auburnensis]